jgi:hypothetical protein
MCLRGNIVQQVHSCVRSLPTLQSLGLTLSREVAIYWQIQIPYCPLDDRPAGLLLKLSPKNHDRRCSPVPIFYMHYIQ